MVGCFDAAFKKIDMLDIVIYSKTVCPYCDRAKALIKSRGLDYKEVNLDNDMPAMQALIEKTGHRTVPQIFINDHFVGGFDQLWALDRERSLHERDASDFT